MLQHRIRVHAEKTFDSQHVDIKLNPGTSAEFLLQECAQRLRIVNYIQSQEQLGQYALFVTIPSESAMERMLGPNDCPYTIIQNTVDKIPLFFIKQMDTSPELMDENLAAMGAMQNDVIIREGTLKKSGRRGLKEKYFMLDRKCIYYGNNKKTIYQAFTRINLESVYIKEAREREHGKNCFELVTPHKTYILRGNNSEDKRKWMQVISKQCSIVAENKIFEDLNERIRKYERIRAGEDEQLVMACNSFDGLVSIQEGKNLLTQYYRSWFQGRSEEELLAETEDMDALREFWSKIANEEAFKISLSKLPAIRFLNRLPNTRQSSWDER